MERVYPNLRDYCQRFGFSFQVVDMRWGIRDEASNDHKTTELCLQELKACQRLSTGPNFVVCFLLSTFTGPVVAFVNISLPIF